mgnify:CR=1 FL=1
MKTTMVPSRITADSAAASKGPLLTYATSSYLSLSSSSRSGDIAASGDDATAVRVSDWSYTAHPEEPNLYLIPSPLHPTYRPIPFLANVLVAICAFSISAATTWRLLNLTWMAPLMALTSGNFSVKKILSFLIKVSR